IQQTFLARDVMIRTRLGEARRRGHITHRSIIVAFAVKYLRGNLENPVPGEIAVLALPFLPLFTHPESTYRPIGRLTLSAHYVNGEREQPHKGIQTVPSCFCLGNLAMPRHNLRF